MAQLGLTAALLAVAAPAMAAAGERIAAPVGGISIEKPAGWSMLPPDATLRNIKEIDFDTPLRPANAPLITLTKYPLSHPGIIPTIKVQYHYFPGATALGPEGVAKLMIGDLRRSLGDLTVVDEPAAIQVSAMPAAHARVSYTLRRGKESLGSITELWVVNRGNGFFVIGAGYAPDEPAVSLSEINAALASVRIAAR